jgi:hypothetical protein
MNKKILLATLENWLNFFKVDDEFKKTLLSVFDKMTEKELDHLVGVFKKCLGLFMPTIQRTALKMKIKTKEDWNKIISAEAKELASIIN